MLGGISLNQFAASAGASSRLSGALHPDTLLWEAAIIANGGTVSDPTLTAANTHIFKPLETLKSKIKQLLLLAGDNLSAARTAAYGSHATVLNFVAGDYSEAGGLTGRSGAVLDSVLTMTGITTNDYGLTMYGKDLNGATSRFLAGSLSGGTPSTLRNFSGTLLVDFNGQAQKTTAPIASGIFSGQARSATDLRLFEGASGAVAEVRSNTANRNSTNITVRPYYMGRNNNGSPDFTVPNTAKLYAAMTSVGLTQTELQTIYTGLRGFNAAIARTGGAP